VESDHARRLGHFRRIRGELFGRNPEPRSTGPDRGGGGPLHPHLVAGSPEIEGREQQISRKSGLMFRQQLQEPIELRLEIFGHGDLA